MRRESEQLGGADHAQHTDPLRGPARTHGRNPLMTDTAPTTRLGVTHELDVCDTCLHLIANGECIVCGWDPEADTCPHAEAIVRRWPDEWQDISIGCDEECV